MTERFQDIRHRHCAYDRPNCDWICGAACKGRPCFLGPDGNGACQAGAEFEGRRSGECLPRREGDGWVCARPETHGGPSCADGPLPDGSCCRRVELCQPSPSLRKLRGIVTATVCLATVGLLTVLFVPAWAGKGGSAAVFDPGPLSAAHSMKAECSACHSDMNLTLDRLLTIHAGG
ncbi:MAG TPA: hypothetical protein VGH65_08760, partial [Verrucomicrobiaceae bacterium]